jgi:gas vesicle protein
MANNGTIIGAGLTGLAVGLALGMLYAPHSGEENRQMIMEKAEQVKMRAMEMREKMMRHGQNDAAEMQT